MIVNREASYNTLSKGSPSLGGRAILICFPTEVEPMLKLASEEWLVSLVLKEWFFPGDWEPQSLLVEVSNLWHNAQVANTGFK